MTDIIKDIKTMKIRSSRTITLESLKFLKQFAKKKGFEKAFLNKIHQLETARPTTTIMLANVLSKIKKKPGINTINEQIEYVESLQEKLTKHGGFQVIHHWYQERYQKLSFLIEIHTLNHTGTSKIVFLIIPTHPVLLILVNSMLTLIFFPFQKGPKPGYYSMIYLNILILPK